MYTASNTPILEHFRLLNLPVPCHFNRLHLWGCEITSFKLRKRHRLSRNKLVIKSFVLNPKVLVLTFAIFASIFARTVNCYERRHTFQSAEPVRSL